MPSAMMPICTSGRRSQDARTGDRRPALAADQDEIAHALALLGPMAQSKVQVASGTVRSSGDTQSPHVPMWLALARDRVTVCPDCGRLFRRAEPPVKLVPAVWPKED